MATRSRTVRRAALHRANLAGGIRSRVSAEWAEHGEARLWIISTEFLVEAEPDESTRFGGA